MPVTARNKPKPNSAEAAAKVAEIVHDAESDIVSIVNRALENVQLRTEEMRLQVAKLLSEVLETPVHVQGVFVEPIDIIYKISELTGVTPESILGRSRRKDFLLPRHLAMYTIYYYTPLSFTAIGKMFGKDHTTVVSARDRVQDALGSGGFETAILASVITSLNLKRVNKQINPRRGMKMSETGRRNVGIGAKNRLDNRTW